MGQKQIKMLAAGLIIAGIFTIALNQGIKIYNQNQAEKLQKESLAQWKEQSLHEFERKTQEKLQKMEWEQQLMQNKLPQPREENLDTAQGAFNMGWDYMTQDKYDEAIGAFSKSIELDPRNFSAYDNRGNAYFFKGNYENAILDYKKAIEIDPNNSPTYDFLARCYYKIGEFDKAWASVRKAGELGHTLDPKFIDALKKYSGKDN